MWQSQVSLSYFILIQCEKSKTINDTWEVQHRNFLLLIFISMTYTVGLQKLLLFANYVQVSYHGYIYLSLGGE